MARVSCKLATLMVKSSLSILNTKISPGQCFAYLNLPLMRLISSRNIMQIPQEMTVSAWLLNIGKFVGATEDYFVKEEENSDFISNCWVSARGLCLMLWCIGNYSLLLLSMLNLNKNVHFQRERIDLCLSEIHFGKNLQDLFNWINMLYLSLILLPSMHNSMDKKSKVLLHLNLRQCYFYSNECSLQHMH